MKGLMIKDMITLSKKINPIHRIILVVVALAVLLPLKSAGAIFLGIVLPVFACSLPLALLTCDDLWKWDKYAIAMPITKKQIVCSRYLFCGATLCIFSVVALALNMGMYLLFHEFSLYTHLAITGVGFLVGLIYLLLILPANYILGQAGSSTVMFLLLVVIVGGTYLLKFINPQITLPTGNQIGIILLFVAIALSILGFASVFISIKSYTKKHS